MIAEKTQSLGFNFSEESETSMEHIKDSVMGELRRTFRPEFLNRIDDIIIFNKLEKEDIRKIAENLLNGLAKRVASLDISLSFTDQAIDQIADIGFDPTYGARPLKRAIQSKIEDKLSEEMLEGNVKANQKVTCDYKDDKFVFEVAELELFPK